MLRVALYNTVVFIGAFLLFQVQPMSAKALLPSFGGSYAVWGACMAFFQLVLLAGYALCHGVGRRLEGRVGARIYWYVLVLLLFAYPFPFAAMAEDPGGRWVVFEVIRRLAGTVGPPVLALSMISVMGQRWLSVSDLPGSREPHVLYAASNAGSLCGLLSYPLLFEPLLGLQDQQRVWWLLYMVMLVGCRFILPRQNGVRTPAAGTAPCDTAPERGRPGAWFVLSASGCALLLAVTNVLTLDVASIPFLWVLPLSVYLLSYVVTFKRHPWNPGWLNSLTGWAALAGLLLFLSGTLRLALPVMVAIPVHLAILFTGCLSVNDRLVGVKPSDPARLSGFYLWIAIGGLAGTIAVSWLIPLVTRSFVEYPLALAAVMGSLYLVRLDRNCHPDPRARYEGLTAIVWMALVLAAFRYLPGIVERAGDVQSAVLLVVLAVPVALAFRWAVNHARWIVPVMLAVVGSARWMEQRGSGVSMVLEHRNYYGLYRIYDRDGVRFLQHGSTLHGRERMAADTASRPMAYYHPTTPIGSLLQDADRIGNSVGMIGLGTGALTAYLKAPQQIRIYEIDPDNVWIASIYFRSLAGAERNGATLHYIVGDGRLSVRREPPASLDCLVVDAFNSGSIPVHLMTVEAFADYRRVLKPAGLLLMHVSNRVLDLEPVVYRNAQSLGMAVCEQSNAGAVHPDAEESHWMALSADAGTIQSLMHDHGWWMRPVPDAVRPWTDDSIDLMSAVWRAR